MIKTVKPTDLPGLDETTANESEASDRCYAKAETDIEIDAVEAPGVHRRFSAGGQRFPPPADTAIDVKARKPCTPNLLYAKRIEPAGEFHLLEAGYELIFEKSRRAAENQTIAAALGCTRETFRKILKRDERAREQLALGRARMSSDLGNVLFQEAMGEREGAAPNILASIYLTKARCGWTDKGDRPLDGVTTLNQVNIQLGPKVTDEEWEKFITGSVKLVGGPDDDDADGDE